MKIKAIRLIKVVKIDGKVTRISQAMTNEGKLIVIYETNGKTRYEPALQDNGGMRLHR
jgi:hypothetical protein